MPKAKKGHYFLKPELNHSTLLFQVKVYILKSLTKMWMYTDSHASLGNEHLYTHIFYRENTKLEPNI